MRNEKNIANKYSKIRIETEYRINKINWKYYKQRTGKQVSTGREVQN